MPGSIPGLPGVAAFAAVKFGGYILAGLALKKIQPKIKSGAVKIAATRTIFGLLLGPTVSIGFLALLDRINHASGLMALSDFSRYFLVGVLRIFIWALVIYLFTRRTEISVGRLWTLAFAGAVWSCLLDIPGIALAWVTPGRIPIC
jgi:hypothetical protein